MARPQLSATSRVIGEDDVALIERCRNGDRAAFTEVVIRYRRPVYNAAFWILRKPEDANDVAQTVFLKVVEQLDDYDPRYRFFSWIYRITVNESLNLLRRHGHEEALDEDVEIADRESANPEWQFDAKERAERVRKALFNVSTNDRTVLMLRHFGELSYDEIAHVLDIVPGVFPGLRSPCVCDAFVANYSVRGRNSAKDFAKVSAKDLARDSAKDSAKEFAKDSAKDLARDSAKDSAKDFAKASAKDLARDAAKDSAKDFAKDSAKDLARDSAKNSAKNFAKDSAKDLARDSAKDSGKGLRKGQCQGPGSRFGAGLGEGQRQGRGARRRKGRRQGQREGHGT